MTTVHEVTHDGGPPLSSYYGTIVDAGSALSVDAAAGLNSSAYGILCDYASISTQSYVTTASFTALSGNDLRLRCRLNLDDLTHAANGATTVFIFAVPLPQSSGPVFAIVVNTKASTADQYRYQFSYKKDGDSGLTVIGATSFDWPVGTGEHCLELRIVKETSDGAADGVGEGFFDGASKVSASNLENFNNFTAFATLGALFGNTSGISGDCYADEFVLDDDASVALCPPTAFRLLGLAADSGHLYATGLEDGATFMLYDYALSNLAEGGAPSSFGAGTDAKINAASLGIFPATRPNAACYLYLYGLDGNSVQIQKNDMNSASGWQDIGAGSATWDASKVAVGLHPSIYDPDDLITAFTDGDVYRTRDEGASWTKTGSVAGSLLKSSRHPTDDNKIYLGGSLAGALDYSHNFGTSSNAIDVSGVAASRDHRILASADDGYVSQSSSAFVDTSTLNFGDVVILGNQEGWVRFASVGISPSSVIDSAYIQFEASTTRTGSITLLIYGEDADDPTAASDFADYNGRTRTTASALWSPSDPWTSGCTYTTPDFADVVQEIVNRSGWTTNNAMQFFIEYSAGCVGTFRQAESFDSSSPVAPLLHIESTGCGGVVNHIEVSL